MKREGSLNLVPFLTFNTVQGSYLILYRGHLILLREPFNTMDGGPFNTIQVAFNTIQGSYYYIMLLMILDSVFQTCVVLSTDSYMHLFYIFNFVFESAVSLWQIKNFKSNKQTNGSFARPLDGLLVWITQINIQAILNIRAILHDHLVAT